MNISVLLAPYRDGFTAAIEAGASHIVVGRPITQAADPVAAFEAIVDELERA